MSDKTRKDIPRSHSEAIVMSGPQYDHEEKDKIIAALQRELAEAREQIKKLDAIASQQTWNAIDTIEKSISDRDNAGKRINHFGRVTRRALDEIQRLAADLASANSIAEKEHTSRLLADDTLLKAQNNAIALMYEVKALKKDAERYRWLRKQQWNTSNLFVVAGGKDRVKLGTDCPSLDRLDALVDTLASEKEKTNG